MFLIVGLGNIGKNYELTRHNLGFLLLDEIIAKYNLNSASSKFDGELFTGQIANEKILALKPSTYMNLSGRAVAQVKNFYKIANENILVFHDDIDLALGKIKVKIGGGDGGHNGLKSIDSTIGKNYTRLRFGIGRPENKNFETSDYVLGKLTQDELNVMDDLNQKISDKIQYLLSGKIEEFLNNIK